MCYYKGLGEGFLVVHHGQDHVHIERGASFIRRNALGVGKKKVCESVTHLPGQLCQLHSCLIISFILYYLSNTRGEPPSNPHITYWQR